MVIAIVQARMGSTRFPGKVLEDIAGRPMLWHVVQRAHASNVDQVVVATSDESRDDAIVAFCATHDIRCFRGSEDDVLDRFYQVARQLRAEVVVRITADCPLTDPEVVARVVDRFRVGDCDYASNTLRYTYPDGLDVEVCSFAALAQAWRDAKTPAEREHVTPYLRTSGRFRLVGVENEEDLSRHGYRWTVDRPEDLEFVRAVYGSLYAPGRTFGLIEVLDLLRRRPELLAINPRTIRNEGYYRSIARQPPVLEPKRVVLDQTRTYLARATKVIPSQTQTFSKGPSQFVQGVSPAFLARGKGSHVWDVDGNEYVDLVLALGPIILGYDYPAVTERAIRQLRDGITLSLPSPLEVELAELLCELIPCAEMVRYGKNGSDVTAGAVRVARAYTGREKIACCGYHGWQDWFIGTTTRSLGVPEATKGLTFTFEYNQPASLEKLFAEHPGQIAAVILEPIGVVEPSAGFLERVKAIAHANGALLIFDEVVTGFRVALGGAQEYFGVTPDLACFGKAMANGFPLAAVVGRRDVMSLFDDVFFSFTFGGETVALAAALATVHEMRSKNVIGHLWEQGSRLKDGFNVLATELGLREYLECVGLPPHTVMTFADKDGAGGLVLRSLLQQELVKRGVLYLVGHNVCYSHSDHDIDHALQAYRGALEVIARALKSGDPARFLEGDPVRPVFRRA